MANSIVNKRTETKTVVEKVTLTLSEREALVLYCLLYRNVNGRGEVREILTDAPTAISKVLGNALGIDPRDFDNNHGVPSGTMQGFVTCKDIPLCT